MPVSESISRPSSPSLKAVMRPAQPTRRKGKLLPVGDSTVAGVRRRLHDADEAVAGERIVDEHEIARLEHVERERGARQENGAAQRKERQHLRKISRPSVAISYPTRHVSLPSRKQQR